MYADAPPQLKLKLKDAPRCPPKRAFEGRSSDFYERRKAELLDWLRMLARDERVCRAPEFHEFLRSQANIPPPGLYEPSSCASATDVADAASSSGSQGTAPPGGLGGSSGGASYFYRGGSSGMVQSCSTNSLTGLQSGGPNALSPTNAAAGGAGVMMDEAEHAHFGDAVAAAQGGGGGPTNGMPYQQPHSFNAVSGHAAATHTSRGPIAAVLTPLHSHAAHNNTAAGSYANPAVAAAAAQQAAKVGLKEFALLKVVGKGSFGKVMQVRKKDTGRIYAMKVLQKANIIKRNQVEHTRTERNVLSRIVHPFIVSLNYAFQTHDKLFFVLDYW